LESLSLAETNILVFNTWLQINEAQHNMTKITKLFDLMLNVAHISSSFEFEGPKT